MIYVMAEDESGLVKIGSSQTSATIKQRLTKLNEGNPRLLKVIAIAPGDFKQEKLLHAKFTTERVRGEWFTRGPLVTAFLKRFVIEPLAARGTWPEASIDDPEAFRSERKEIPLRQAREAAAKRAREEEHRRKREEDRRQEIARRAANTKAGKVRVPSACSSCGKVGHYTSNCPRRIIRMSDADHPYNVATGGLLTGHRPAWSWRDRERSAAVRPARHAKTWVWRGRVRAS